MRGAYASSRTLGAGCGGRGSAQDEARRSRTAKPCGPDAPTLAFKLAKTRSASRRRWWQKSPVTRESAEEAVKTIARGRPERSDFTCGDYTRVFSILHTGPRVQRAPGLPCALSFRGARCRWITRARRAARSLLRVDRSTSLL